MAIEQVGFGEVLSQTSCSMEVIVLGAASELSLVVFDTYLLLLEQVLQRAPSSSQTLVNEAVVLSNHSLHTGDQGTATGTCRRLETPSV